MSGDNGGMGRGGCLGSRKYGVSWWNCWGSCWRGGVRHEEYVQQDLVQTIHVAHAMVMIHAG